MSQTKAQLIDNLVSPITGALGSASAPTFSFTADPNTGIYSPGADQVAISTNGTDRLLIDASGNIGIGQAAVVNASLTLGKNITGGGISYGILSQGTVQSDVTLNAAYFITSPKTQAATFTLANLYHYHTVQGTIGAGSAVTNQYGFSAGGNLTGATNNYGFYSNISSGTNRWNFYANGTADSYFASNNFIWANGGSEKARIDSSGRLGIGTSTFSYLANKLVIDKGSTGNDGITIVSSNTSNACIWFADGTTGSEAYRGGIDYNHSTDKMQIYTGGQGNITIDSAGRLGIGNTSPGYSLDVTGAVRAAGDSSNVAFAHNGDRSIRDVGSGTATYIDLATGSASHGQLIVRSSASVIERLRCDSSGRLLVGTSTARGVASATNSLTQVETSTYLAFSAVNNTNDGGGSAIALGKSRGTAAGGTTIVQSGDDIGTIFFAGANGTNLESQAASIKATVDGTPGASDMPGRLVFSTTADGAASPTERMRIDSSGNLMVGVGSYPTGATVGAVINGSLGLGSFSRASDACLLLNTNTDSQICRIYRSGSQVGSISVSTVSTTYNTTSDYRLKTVVGAVTGHGARIDALEPIEYTWNLNGQRARGFLAHKFQEVYAQSVTGTKDAVDTESNPEYQSMQAGSSEVIADLVAEIQSLRARLTALEGA